MNHGIANALPARTVKFHLLGNASLAEMKNRIVLIVLENCSLSDAQHAPSQLQVKTLFNYCFLYVE